MHLRSIVQDMLWPRGLILAYHRVADLTTDPWGLAVSPENFAAQLDVLRSEFKPVSLSRLLDTGLRGRPTNSIAVTFDDGYADNLLAVKPLLGQHGVPATCFITTGEIGKNEEFWWDALDRIILETEALPQTLTLVTRGGPNEWSTVEPASPRKGSTNSLTQLFSAGRFAAHISSARIRLYGELWESLRRADAEERAEMMRQLYAWAGVPELARASHRKMTREELLVLADGHHIDVGAHSVTHAPLSQLDHASRQRELRQSKEFLEQLVGPRQFGFAYPHGDHDETTRELVADTGFTFACTTQAGLVDRTTPRFQLPRCTILNWSGDEFYLRLKRWQENVADTAECGDNP